MIETILTDLNEGNDKNKGVGGDSCEARKKTKFKYNLLFFQHPLLKTQMKILIPVFISTLVLVFLLLRSAWNENFALSNREIAELTTTFTISLDEIKDSVDVYSHQLSHSNPHQKDSIIANLKKMVSNNSDIERAFFLDNNPTNELIVVERNKLGSLQFSIEEVNQIVSSLKHKYEKPDFYINDNILAIPSIWGRLNNTTIVKLVVDDDGEFLGVLGLDLSIKKIMNFIESKEHYIKEPPLVQVYLFDHNDFFLASYSNDGSNSKFDSLQDALVNENTNQLLDYDLSKSEFWKVVLKTSKSSVYSNIIDDVVIYLVIILFVLILFVFIVKRIAVSYYQNIVAIDKAITKISFGDLSVNTMLPNQCHVEIGRIYNLIDAIRLRNICISSLCDEISLGDIDQFLPLLSEKDYLGKSFNKMVQQNSLNELSLKNTVIFEESRARTDSLTGIGNRLMFEEDLNKKIKSNQRFENQKVAVILLDLNKFKPINDTYGHKAGDATLISVAKRIYGVLRHDSTFSRIGGDEFAILVTLSEAKELSFILDRIINVFKAPVYYESFKITIECSIGVAFLGHTDDCDSLLHKADSAMYKSKKSRVEFSLFDNELDSEIKRSREVIALLPDAIQNGEIRSAFQPINRIDRKLVKSGDPIMVEVLLRWHSQNEYIKGMNVGEIISLIERSKVMDLLTKKTVSQCALLKSKLNRDILFSINISPYQFRRDNFLESLCLWIKENGLKNENFILEITERFNSEIYETVLNRTSLIKSLGFGLSLDDLGAGNTSLNQVLNFHANFIKLDILLLRNARETKEGLKVFNNICKFSLNTGADVIAEGIEGPEDLDIVTKAKCTYWQGYYSSRPLLIDDFVKFYKNNIHHLT